MQYLEFEKPIEELNNKLIQARELADLEDVDASKTINDIENQILKAKKEIYNNLSPKMLDMYPDFLDFFESGVWHGQRFKKGGRVKRAAGGVMDLGGMEKDYRFDGGFVPLGEYEKKDDVPARLSKNEFVFTADAVRAAGGGSINKGAKKMYDTMKTLEAQPTAKRMTA